MKFNIETKKESIGYRVDVQVNAEGGEEIASVSTTYENFEIGNDYLSPSEVQYQRIFTQVGGYTPGVERTVVVSATNNAGKQQTASRRWKD
ncbi:MAG: hypothetical protein PHD01_01715 [Geobacteraceae bacterium]|nr:hypothetical protein [Geobacteraceae bacterium]